MTATDLSIISTLTVLVPIAVGIFAFKGATFFVRIFLFFFLIGFTVDVSNWYLIKIDRKDIAQTIFYIYVLIEPIWLTFFTGRSLQIKIRWLIVVELILFFFWIIAHINLQILNWLNPTFTDTFSMILSMFISALSGYALLRFSQKPDTMLYRSEFWFLLAIFIYCFTTFFLNEYILSELLHKIWYLHNTMNIISYFIFADGFYVSISKRKLIEKERI